MKKRTTIQIENETLKKLFKEKQKNNETYDEVVKRLLKKEIKLTKKKLGI